MKQNAIICDVHNTIFDTDNGKPFQNVIDFLDQHSSTHKIIMMTSSPEKDRDEIMNELRKYKVQFDQLIMNKAEEDSDEYKHDEIKDLMKKYNIVLFIDNKKENRQAIKDLGIETKKPENISNKILTKTVWSGIFI